MTSFIWEDYVFFNASAIYEVYEMVDILQSV